jgi:hypothetical protein
MAGVPEDEAGRLVASGKGADLMDRINAKFADTKVGGGRQLAAEMRRRGASWRLHVAACC